VIITDHVAGISSVLGEDCWQAESRFGLNCPGADDCNSSHMCADDSVMSVLWMPHYNTNKCDHMGTG